MSITLSTCLSRNLFQHSLSSITRICCSVNSGYILSHLLSWSQLLFYLEIVLTNCTVLISEKNYIKLSRLLFIVFLEVLAVLLSRETVPLDSVIWCHGYSELGKGNASSCSLPVHWIHTFRFGNIFELPLIFTSFLFQGSSVFLNCFLFIYIWGSICYFNFLCNCISKLWPFIFFADLFFHFI